MDFLDVFWSFLFQLLFLSHFRDVQTYQKITSNFLEHCQKI